MFLAQQRDCNKYLLREKSYVFVMRLSTILGERTAEFVNSRSELLRGKITIFSCKM